MPSQPRPLTKGDIQTGAVIVVVDAQTKDRFEVGVCKVCSALYMDLAMHVRSHGADPYA